MTTGDEILSREEAAEFIRMSLSWLTHSDVPRVRLGRRTVFLKSQLIRYMESHLTHSVPARRSA
jgi:hypothetical protein